MHMISACKQWSIYPNNDDSNDDDNDDADNDKKKKKKNFEKWSQSQG